MMVKPLAAVLRELWHTLTATYLLGLITWGAFVFVLFPYSASQSDEPEKAEAAGIILTFLMATLAFVVGHILRMLLDSPITRFIPRYWGFHLSFSVALLIGLCLLSAWQSPALISLHPSIVPLVAIGTTVGLSIAFIGSGLLRLCVVYAACVVVVTAAHPGAFSMPVPMWIVYVIAPLCISVFSLQVRQSWRTYVPRRSLLASLTTVFAQISINMAFVDRYLPWDAYYKSDEGKYGTALMKVWPHPLIFVCYQIAVFTFLAWFLSGRSWAWVLPAVPALATMGFATGVLLRGSDELTRLWYMSPFRSKSDLIAHILVVVTRQIVKGNILLWITLTAVLVAMRPKLVMPITVQMALAPVTSLLSGCLAASVSASPQRVRPMGAASLSASPERVPILGHIDLDSFVLPGFMAGLHLWLAYLVHIEDWALAIGLALGCVVLLPILARHTIHHMAHMPWSDRA